MINRVKTRVCCEQRSWSRIHRYLCSCHVVPLLKTQDFFLDLSMQGFSNTVATVVIQQRPVRAQSVHVRCCLVSRMNPKTAVTNSHDSCVLSLCLLQTTQTQLYRLSSRRAENILATVSMLFLFVLFFLLSTEAVFL